MPRVIDESLTGYNGYTNSPRRYGLIQHDADTFYVIQQLSSGAFHRRSVNALQTFDARVTTFGSGIQCVDSYSERWNVALGGSGERIHLFCDRDSGSPRGVRTMRLTPSTNSLSSEVIVQSGSAHPGINGMTGGVALSGRVYCTGGGSFFFGAFFRFSDDSGDTWSDFGVGLLEIEGDAPTIWPDASTADPDDATCIYMDSSAGQLSIKQIDASGPSVAETVFASGISVHHADLASSFRSNGHIVVAALDTTSSPNNLLTWDVFGNVATPKTNVLTNTANVRGVAIQCLDDDGDKIVVWYRRGNDICFKVSDDGMETWGDEQIYLYNVGAEIYLHADPRPVGSLASAVYYDSGGVSFPSWWTAGEVAPDAGGIPQLLFGSGDLTNAAAVRYLSLMCHLSTEDSVSKRHGPIPTSGRLDGHRFELSAAPGVGKSWLFELLRDGSPTGHSITISGTDTVGEYLGDAAPFAADTTAVWRVTPSGTPTLATAMYGSRWRADDGESMIWTGPAGGIALEPSAVRYNSLGCTPDGWDATLDDRDVLWGAACNIHSLYVRLTSAVAAATSYTFRPMVEGVAAGSDVAIDGTDRNRAVGMTCAVASLDVVGIRSTPAGSPSNPNASYGIAYTPTTPGAWNISGMHGADAGGFTAGTVQYGSMVEPAEQPDPSQTVATMLASAATNVERMIAQGLTVRCETTPSAGTRVFNVLHNGADSALQLSFTPGDTELSVDDQIDFQYGDKWVLECDSTAASGNTNLTRWTLYPGGPVAIAPTATLSGTILT